MGGNANVQAGYIPYDPTKEDGGWGTPEVEPFNPWKDDPIEGPWLIPSSPTPKPSSPYYPTHDPTLPSPYKPGDYLPPGRVPRTPSNPFGQPGWDDFDPTRWGNPSSGQQMAGGGETAESNLPPGGDGYPDDQWGQARRIRDIIRTLKDPWWKLKRDARWNNWDQVGGDSNNTGQTPLQRGYSTKDDAPQGATWGGGRRKKRIASPTRTRGGLAGVRLGSTSVRGGRSAPGGRRPA